MSQITSRLIRSWLKIDVTHNELANRNNHPSKSVEYALYVIDQSGT